MKRWLAILAAVIIIIPARPAWGAPPDYCGGVNNEYEYQEVVFLSGEPVLFKGSFSAIEKNSESKGSVSYKFDLKPADPSIKGSLDRRVSYESVYTNFSPQGQTTASTEVKSYRESVVIGDKRYSLEDYQFSRSDVIDRRPAADFFSGTIAARKVYQLNKDEGLVTVDISGGIVGYSNFWGKTETQVLDHSVHCQGLTGADEEAEAASWSGTVRMIASDSVRKSLSYSPNEVTLSSFPGGHMTVSKEEMTSSCQFDLPEVEEGVVLEAERVNGCIELNQTMLPDIQRLILPKFKDLGGHWAEEDIKKLYSLNVFQGTSAFFLPDAPMTRRDFVRAVMRSCNIKIEESQSTGLVRARKTAPQTPLLRDVLTTDPDYAYVKEALNRGLAQGSGGYFLPDAPLTRAQAVTILIRGLGFEYNAPAPGFFSSFRDDADIPAWSKDSVYMARQIGLLNGDTTNRCYPNQVMSRAEASTMLIRFLNFLERDLQQDYRENIVLYK